MSTILILAVTSVLSLPGFGASPWKKCDPHLGRFVRSTDGPVAGPHGVRQRKFVFAPMPSLKGLKTGWNYTRVNRKRHGLQIYVLGTSVNVEYYDHGTLRSTATYRKGKPGGGFYRHDARGRKDGLQYYTSGSYYSIELYDHGKKVRFGAYKDGIPNGWFFQYNTRGQKHGVQINVGKNSWTIEHYENGKQHGFAGTYRGRVKHGWHYMWSHGKMLRKTYYVNGVAR